MKTMKILTGFVCLVASVIMSLPAGLSAATTGPMQVTKPFAVAKEGSVYWIRWFAGPPLISAKCIDKSGGEAIYTMDSDIARFALEQALAGKSAYVIVNDASTQRTLLGHQSSPCEVINYYVMP